MSISILEIEIKHKSLIDKAIKYMSSIKDYI